MTAVAAAVDAAAAAAATALLTYRFPFLGFRLRFPPFLFFFFSFFLYSSLVVDDTPRFKQIKQKREITRTNSRHSPWLILVRKYNELCALHSPLQSPRVLPCGFLHYHTMSVAIRLVLARSYRYVIANR